MADVVLPYNLTADTLADATQVMADFNALVSAINDLTIDNFGSTLQEALVPTGTILATGRSTPPSNSYLMCDGSSVSRAAYQNLFNAIDTAYGQGETPGSTFALPNLIGRVPVGADPTNAVLLPASKRALGEKAGVERHQLDITEMPIHSHTARAGTFDCYDGSATGRGAPGNGVNSFGSTADAGNGLPHNNMPPYQVVNYIIKT